MPDIAIKVENLGKRYLVGHNAIRTEGYTSLRDVMAWNFRSLMHKTKNMLSGTPIIQGDEIEEFWALKDAAFEVRQGDRVGIIGRNGAGKSTLLKLLSRITEPTTGSIQINGRVASLLEVGTGFHPELSGRENIYLNGAILGMSRKEIQSKFDEIVDFSEVERFLDTPVKRYSSGMYVRLAFAVAAHLEPEILVVDEVLAVGDAQFQKKCLGKMDDISKGGRTILFVSHNMGAIEQLCNSAILLRNGGIVRNSTDIPSVIKDYVHANDSEGLSCQWETPGTMEFDNDYFRPIKLYLSDAAGNEIKEMPIRNDQDVWINVVGETRKLDPALYFGIGVFTDTETLLFGSGFFDSHPDTWPEISLGINSLKCRLPKHTLNEGAYKIELHGGLLHKEFYHVPGMENPRIYFEIMGGLSESPKWTEKRLGLFAPLLEWTN